VPSYAPRLAALALCAACATPGSGPVVRAPSVQGEAPPVHVAPRSEDKLTACALPWTLEDVTGGPGQVVVVCAGEVRREEVQPGPITRAIDPALEPARQRVCSCAERMPAPPSADLVVTSIPDDGVASVEPGELEEEVDAELGRAFFECVGKLRTRFPPTHSDACGAGKATFVYTLSVDLAR
jgi:hypothetical protein